MVGRGGQSRAQIQNGVRKTARRGKIPGNIVGLSRHFRGDDVPTPSKLTDDVREQIARVVRAGGTVELAASVASVSERTLARWMERGQYSGRRDAPYRALRDAVERAHAEHEGILVAQLSRAASKGSWRAAAWLLERRFPERWARTGERPDVSDVDDRDDPLDELDELAPRRRRGGDSLHPA